MDSEFFWPRTGESDVDYFDRTGMVGAFVITADDIVTTSVEFMTIDGYENIAMSMAVYPNQGENVVYTALGLAEEAGEFVGKIKKIIRAGCNPNTFVPGTDEGDALHLGLAKELGDVLWYVTAAAKELGFTLEEIAQMNIEKLKGRQERGTLASDSTGGLGEGDDR